MAGRGCLQGRCAPPLLQALRSWGVSMSFTQLQVLVWALTFLSYTLYHASRKPLSIVKGVLDPSSGGDSSGAALLSFFLAHTGNSTITEPQPGWAPFDGKAGKTLLGQLDLAFLTAYSLGMYFSGHIADRLNLRYFLALGMVGSGLFVCLFGMGFFWDIHSMAYYTLVQMLAGLLQASGWPSVVAVMAHWFEREGRGLVMGVWNAHTSLGNIVGSLSAAAVLGWGWGWGFLIPGLSILAGGLLVFLLLPSEPEDVGHESPHPTSPADALEAQEEGSVPGVVGGSGDQGLKSPLLSHPDSSTGSASSSGGSPRPVQFAKSQAPGRQEGKGVEECAAGGLPPSEPAEDFHREAIGFLEAWSIPGVASYALSLFFAKLVVYTFLNWLPFYISHTEIHGQHLSDALAGVTSTVFDLGGIAGGILAGHLSDRSGASALVSAGFMLCSVPAMASYFLLGHLSLWANILLLVLVGFFVNAPYALITCAVSADLGQHHSLRGNARALSTVTGIIDGTGSLGAGVGPFLAGAVADFLGVLGWGERGGWAGVFLMLMLSSSFSVLCVARLAMSDWEGLKHRR